MAIAWSSVVPTRLTGTEGVYAAAHVPRIQPTYAELRRVADRSAALTAARQTGAPHVRGDDHQGEDEALLEAEHDVAVVRSRARPVRTSPRPRYGVCGPASGRGSGKRPFPRT